MKIYKIFKTFGLDEAIINGFKKTYSKLFDMSSESKQKLQKEFKRKEYYLGEFILPQNILKLIFDKYGKPKFEIPNQIYFYVVYHKDPGAYFTVNREGKFIIAKESCDLFDLYYDSTHSYQWFENCMKHEIQHLIRRFYAKNDDSTNEYYERDSEIQAYSHNIALMALEDIKETYNSVIKFSDPLKVLNKLKATKSDLITKYVFFRIKSFLTNIEDEQTIISENTKRKYRTASVENFSNMFDNWIEGQIKNMNSKRLYF